MKITIKTLQQETFDVEVNENETVGRILINISWFFSNSV